MVGWVWRTVAGMSTQERPFRFGVNLRDSASAAEFAAKCRRAEGLGYDVLNIPDHLHMLSPFPTAVAAAAATEKARIGTHVLNVGFWNPALLARDVATTDKLIDGRLDLGLGGGTVKAEFDEAGIQWERIDARMTRLVDTIGEVKRILAADDAVPMPAQRPHPPILIGGSGHKAIDVAARHADIFDFGAVKQAVGGAAGELWLLTEEESDERIAYFREKAGERAADLEMALLLQHAEVGDGAKEDAAKWVEQTPYLTTDQLLRAPGVLFGSAQEVAERLHEHRERYGFSYFSIHEPAMEQLAKVIPLVR